MNVAAFKTQAETPSLKLVTWEEFERKYLEREDRYKYEWVDGVVVKTLRTMNQQQQFIEDNLLDFFENLKKSNPGLGRLKAEVDTWFGSAFRRPDLCHFTPEQMEAYRTTNQEPQFVIEVIPTRDQMNKANEKLADYHKVGIPVVWHVFPKLKKVDVYMGKHMTICTGDDPCSAEPVIPGFALPAKDVFK